MRLYNTSRWRKLRLKILAQQPLCKICERMGKVTASDTVDHIIPHKGNPKLFWDVNNLQGVCKSCHDSIKAAEERSGKVSGCDASGMPIDPGHHWNK
jgi:5-methylcytosine-specific restriction endonuclease McrA